MTRPILQAVVVTLLLTSLPLAGGEFRFDLLPEDGRIAGDRSETVGWGYVLSNFSPTDWLVPTTLDAGLFSYSVPELFFTFPILPPGTQVTVPFDLFTAQGLYGLTWNPDTSTGAVEAGEFVLGAEWWSGDPFVAGVYLRQAEWAVAPFEARLVVIPEPSNLQIAIIIAGFYWAILARVPRADKSAALNTPDVISSFLTGAKESQG